MNRCPQSSLMFSVWCVNEHINTWVTGGSDKVSCVSCFSLLYPYGFTVTLNNMCEGLEGLKPLIFTVHLTSCIFLFITLVCSFPDVRMDTSAHDAYRLSRCGCTCPILSKVCSLDMSSWEQRHSCHWITSVDSCCPPPSPQFSSSFSSSFSFSGQHAMSCALHHVHGGVIHGNTLLRLSVVVLLF